MNALYREGHLTGKFTVHEGESEKKYFLVCLEHVSLSHTPPPQKSYNNKLINRIGIFLPYPYISKGH